MIPMLGAALATAAHVARTSAASTAAAVRRHYSSGNSMPDVNINNAAAQISNLREIAQDNSAFNAAQAEKQRSWSAEQAANAMRFNSQEAAKNRDWINIMSNTAHQREIKDLMAAGLNPVLSAMNGNGASVGSGATASGVVGSGSSAVADTSTSAAIANLIGSILSAQTSLQNANINARTQEAVADKYNAMSEIVANINAAAGIKQAGIHAGATTYAAEQSAAASRYMADKTKYGMLDNIIGGIADIFSHDSGSSSSSSSAKSVVTKAAGSANSFLKKNDSWSKHPGGITPWNESLLGKFFNKLFKKK